MIPEDLLSCSFVSFVSLVVHWDTTLRSANWPVAARTLYSRRVLPPVTPRRSPTPPLILGLVITLAAVVAYSAYITHQISGLRQSQNRLVDRNRKDSLQLLRIQNDLNSLALAMRDMLDNNEPYPLTAWSNQFERIRADLDDALRQEEQVSSADRTPDQQQYLKASVGQLWDAVDRTFALAREGKQQEARDQIQLSLQARQAALTTAVARLLVQNNESEEQAVSRVREIYDRVERQVYWFLTATLIAILVTSAYLIRTNRQWFAQLAMLSEQRSELAQKSIATQESTLRHLSRELHDEFGQILTAVGSMLTRAGNQAPEGSALRADLREVLARLRKLRSTACGHSPRLCTRSCSMNPASKARSTGTCPWWKGRREFTYSMRNPVNR